MQEEIADCMKYDTLFKSYVLIIYFCDAIKGKICVIVLHSLLKVVKFQLKNDEVIVNYLRLRFHIKRDVIECFDQYYYVHIQCKVNMIIIDTILFVNSNEISLLDIK